MASPRINVSLNLSPLEREVTFTKPSSPVKLPLLDNKNDSLRQSLTSTANKLDEKTLKLTVNRISSDDTQENDFLNLQDVPLFDRVSSQACEIKAPKFDNTLRKINSIVKDDNLLVPPTKSCHGCSSLSVWTGPDLDDGTMSVNTFCDPGSDGQFTILGGL